MIGIRECKIHGLVKFYLKSDGRIGECTLCKKIRTSRSNNPPVISILEGDQVWINNVAKISWKAPALSTLSEREE